MPRIDAETGYGIVTDVCIKLKIRTYVEIVKKDALGFKIYIKDIIPRNTQREMAYMANGIEVPKKEERQRVETATLNKLRRWMRTHFYDFRAFGAVMTTVVNHLNY